MSDQPTVEFFYDFSSPFSYLAATQIEDLAERAGAKLIWKPFLLGGLFRTLGGPMVPLLEFSESKRRHALKDLMRWADVWEVPFAWPAQFPMRTILPLRVSIALGQDRCAPFVQAAFRAYWADGRDISTPETCGELLAAADLPVEETLAGTQDPAVKHTLIAAGDEAAERGVFGAPTFFVNGDQMFWGQDRLDFVERALGGWRLAAGA